MKHRFEIRTLLMLLFVIITCVWQQKAKAQCSANFNYTIGAAGSVTVTSNSTGTSSSTNYTWGIGNSSFPNFGPSITYTFVDNQIFPVTLTISDNSVNPVCNSTITKTIGIVNVPCLTLTNLYSGASPNGVIYFNCWPVGQNYNGSSGYTFLWSFGDGGTGNIASPTHTYLTSGVYNVSLIAISYSGICTYTAAKTISVTATPCALVAGFNYSVGSNGILNLTSTSSGTNNNTDYRWNFFGLYGLGMLYNSTPSYTLSALNNGTFPIALSVEYNNPFYCKDTITQLVTISNSTCSATTPFTLQKVPNQNFTWNGLVSYPTNVSSVNWDWGDGSSSNNLFPTHVYAAAGQYNICLTVTVSCGTVYSACTFTYLNKMSNSEADQIVTVNIIQDPTTGLTPFDNQNQTISIFPNPNNSNFSLHLKGFEIGKEVSLSVTNILGEEIYAERILINDGLETKKLELSEAKSGTYFVKVNYNNKVNVTKLLIVR